jgi:hypothetical protein
MKLGPIVVMRSSSFGQLVETQTMLTEENSRLSSELGAGTTVHSFMHYPWTASTAKQLICQADSGPACREAVERVFAAYRASQKDARLPDKCMWDLIEKRNKPFVEALVAGDIEQGQQILSRMFQTDVIWGLGKYDQVLLDDMRRVPERSHCQLRVTDALVSLAQAVGAAAVTSVEQQGVKAHLEALKVDLELLLAEVEKRCGLAVSSPRVGAAYGCEIGGRLVTIDSLLHSYTLYRLKELGAGRNSQIAEIGGGFGCLAALAYEAGLKNYAIFDLPWVNAIQGYYLIMSLPPGSVRLYGETTGSLTVNPFWTFDQLFDRSLDFVVNTDSLPEMGRLTAANYIKQIGRILSGLFLSINQEAKANNGGFGQQNSVGELVKELGGMTRLSRSLYWMRQGYVEEVYSPV